MNYIAKILMNSLYGRFGLNPLLPETIVIDKNDLDDFVDSSEISDLIDLGDKFIIQFLSRNKIELFNSALIATESNSNIAIASAITAYSRMTFS
jgi:DNA polymerase type B, organellar and viral